MSIIRLLPGSADLATWRAVHAGAGFELDPSCRPQVERGDATIQAIVAKGEPVYGVNTGFGKLASVRIGTQDLAELQRNIVLSHAAGVGVPLGRDIVRLIIAMKAASLGQGASGVRWSVIERLQQALARDLVPIIPAQGSVGASGDLAPLAHLAAALFLGVGEMEHEGRRQDAASALVEAGLDPLPLGPKEGLALLNGTQVSTSLALAGVFAARAALPGGARHRRAGDGCGERLGRAFRSTHPCIAPPARPDRHGGGTAGADARQ